MFQSYINNYNEHLNREFIVLNINSQKLIENDDKDLEKIQDKNYSIDFRVYQNRRKKDILKKDNKVKNTLYDEYNPNNIEFNNISDEQIIQKIDYDSLSFDEKKDIIYKYIDLKNIYLDEDEILKLNNIINNDNIKLSKYISTNVYGDIIKISFITKIKESNIYHIDISNEKNKKKSYVKKQILKTV